MELAEIVRIGRAIDEARYVFSHGLLVLVIESSNKLGGCFTQFWTIP